MEIKLVLSSGKEIQLTEAEFKELKDSFSEKEYVPYSVGYPSYPLLGEWIWKPWEEPYYGDGHFGTADPIQNEPYTTCDLSDCDHGKTAFSMVVSEGKELAVYDLSNAIPEEVHIY